MARISPRIPDSPNLDGHQMGIVPSAEQSVQLNIPLSITIPKVIIIEDSDEEWPSYSNEPSSPTTANTPPSSPTTSDLLDLITLPADVDPQNVAAATNTVMEDAPEDEELKPGTYLECCVCGTLFDLEKRKPRQPWYAVFVGRTVGVFKSWSEAAANVNGVSNARHLRFKTREAARAAFDEAQKAGKVKVRLSNREIHTANDAAQGAVADAMGM